MVRTKGKFASDVLLLTLGSFLAQVVSVAAAPAMTRLFSPEAFGIATLFTSITGVVGVAVCLRYDRSIIVPESDDDAAYLVEGSALAVLVFTVLSVVFVACARGMISRWLNAPELSGYLWLLPLNLFFYGNLAALNTWGTRKKKFGLLTLVQLMSAVCYVGGSLAAGMSGRRSGGYLIVTALLGSAISAVVMFVKTRSDYSRAATAPHNFSRMWQVLKRYARFPKFSIASALVSSTSTELPTFLLSGFFSTTVVGQFALCSRLLRLPLGLIGTNIARVFSQRASEAKYEGKLADLVASIFSHLVALGMFPFCILALIGKDLFVVVFGQRWADAGIYAQILSVWAFFWFMSTSLSVVLDIVEEQAFELRTNLLILVTRGASLIVGCLMGKPTIALGIFAACDGLVSCYYCFAIMKRCALAPGKMVGVLAVHFAMFVPAGLILVSLRYFGVSPITIVACAVLLCGFYYMNLLRISPEVREVVASLLRRFRVQEVAAS